MGYKDQLVSAATGVERLHILSSTSIGLSSAQRPSITLLIVVQVCYSNLSFQFDFRLLGVFKVATVTRSIMPALDLPQLPVPHEELVEYIAKHPDTPMIDLLKPYRQYEAQLRQAYAQHPDNEALENERLNVLPLFTADTPDIRVRARDLAVEPQNEKDRYIMTLPEGQRRPNGSPAVVQSLKEFQNNFNVFSESSLVDLDWDNVVASGSSVVNCVLPVPQEYNTSKRKLREFYHEKYENPIPCQLQT